MWLLVMAVAVINDLVVVILLVVVVFEIVTEDGDCGWAIFGDGCSHLVLEIVVVVATGVIIIFTSGLRFLALHHSL